MPSRKAELHQFFTPTWAAEALVSEFFPELNQEHFVVDPSVGDGRFLMALPEGVRAMGVEIDPEWAAEARKNSPHPIITGDFREAKIDEQPTHIIGNPPYDLKVIDGFLTRSHELLPENGKIGFLVPAYMFQTASRVVRYSEQFSLSQCMIPRNLFSGLQYPLMFATFTKDQRRIMSGLFLYAETYSVQQLSKEFRYLFIGNDSRASLWGEVAEKALVNLGGEACLSDIYQEVEGTQPTGNPFWREQIRKVLRANFVRVGKARYRLHSAMTTAAA